ncbi:DNA repair protein XRCC4 isoform X3 [Triticum urartu]|uniref:DNA repair protein XRCC4 isoform X3 n=1 Tax=Triticum urartu TaxID=4572 RepID=UPI002043D492|nr:DNA repair protein XRCC4 isoform X3 [Triticum urartu]
MATAAAAPRHSCAKLSVAVEDPKAPGGGGIFVKATWLPTRFSLAVTDGAGAWVADASDAEVRLRAEQWDQPVSEYLALAERYLAFHQPSSTYSFHEAGAGRREEVVRKTQSFEKVKQEAENCLQQSERFNTEKAEFEQASFTKFVAVLNSKKAKLRQLKDRIAALESTEKAPKEEEEEEGHSTDRTEPIEDGSDKDHSVNDEPSETGSGGDPHSSPEKSAAAATSRGRRGRKRTRK